MDQIPYVHCSFRAELILNDQTGLSELQTCLWLQLFGDLLKINTQRYTFWCLIYLSFKENPFLRCCLCWCKACKHLPSIWYGLLEVPGQPCLSINCLFNLQPQTWEDVWCNNGSDGNMIIEPTLIAFWEGLEINFDTFFGLMMALCCVLSMLRQYFNTTAAMCLLNEYRKKWK